MNDFTGRYYVYTGGVWLDPRCPNCFRFYKKPKLIWLDGFGDYKGAKDARCSKCGPIEPVFIGFF